MNLFNDLMESSDYEFPQGELIVDSIIKHTFGHNRKGALMMLKHAGVDIHKILNEAYDDQEEEYDGKHYWQRVTDGQILTVNKRILSDTYEQLLDAMVDALKESKLQLMPFFKAFLQGLGKVSKNDKKNIGKFTADLKKRAKKINNFKESEMNLFDNLMEGSREKAIEIALKKKQFGGIKAGFSRIGNYMYLYSVKSSSPEVLDEFVIANKPNDFKSLNPRDMKITNAQMNNLKTVVKKVNQYGGGYIFFNEDIFGKMILVSPVPMFGKDRDEDTSHIPNKGLVNKSEMNLFEDLMEGSDHLVKQGSTGLYKMAKGYATNHWNYSTCKKHNINNLKTVPREYISIRNKGCDLLVDIYNNHESELKEITDAYVLLKFLSDNYGKNDSVLNLISALGMIYTTGLSSWKGFRSDLVLKSIKGKNRELSMIVLFFHFGGMRLDSADNIKEVFEFMGMDWNDNNKISYNEELLSVITSRLKKLRKKDANNIDKYINSLKKKYRNNSKLMGVFNNVQLINYNLMEDDNLMEGSNYRNQLSEVLYNIMEIPSGYPDAEMLLDDNWKKEIDVDEVLNQTFEMDEPIDDYRTTAIDWKDILPNGVLFSSPGDIKHVAEHISNVMIKQGPYIVEVYLLFFNKLVEKAKYNKVPVQKMFVQVKKNFINEMSSLKGRDFFSAISIKK